MSDLFVWVKPAWVRGSPLDHTWVTTYDNRVTPFKTVGAVAAAGEAYWYCAGDFHPSGQSRKFVHGLLEHRIGGQAARCLVAANRPDAHKPQFRYGRHGVCHQLANQVLFPCKITVKGAAGARLSTAIYGTYGRNHEHWNAVRVACGLPSAMEPQDGYSASPLYQRARRYFGVEGGKPKILERARRFLLHTVDDIDDEKRIPRRRRAEGINQRIKDFTSEALRVMNDEAGALYVLGIQSEDEARIVDPRLYDIE